MKTLFIGINSKYIHPATGIHQLICNSRSETAFKEFTIKDKVSDIINYIESESFDLLAFSLYIWNIEIFKKIMKKIRKNIDQPILVGGPEVYDNYDFLFSLGVNFIINGEGEESFNELCEYLEAARDLTDVSNLYYLQDGEIKFTYFEEPNLKLIRHDYSLIDDFKNKIVYVEASRGCFFHCSYCMASLDNNVRFFDTLQVKDELKYLLSKNVKTIKFLDRSFNVRKDVMLEIFNFIKENDNQITTFQFEVVGDILTSEVIDLLNSMRKASIRLEIGIQSTNEKTLKAINRSQNFALLKENIIKLKDNLVIHADLIAGLPYEDYYSFINTFNESFLIFSDELQLGFLKELKGTVLSKEKDKYGYKFQSEAPYEVIENNYITHDELNEIKKCEEALDKFYNKNKFPACNNYLFNVLKLDPFYFYHDLKEYIDVSLSSLQKDQVYRLFFEFASNKVFDKDYLYYLMKQDYLTSCLLKPKIFWKADITKKERREIFEKIISHNNISLDDLYKSSKVEKYKNHYFVVLYKDRQCYIFFEDK